MPQLTRTIRSQPSRLRVPVGEGGSPLEAKTRGSRRPCIGGSGESEIRRWIIESDWLEAIVALPEQRFYNTGITSYVWVLTNRKKEERRGKVHLIDARDQWVTRVEHFSTALLTVCAMCT